MTLSGLVYAAVPRQWRIYCASAASVVPRPVDCDIARLDALRRLRRPDLPSEFFNDRHGAVWAWVALVDGTLAAVLWAMEPSSYSGRFFHFAPGEAELGYAHTLLPYRGRGLIRSLIARASLDLAAAGFHELLAFIEPRNRASIRAFEACGFRSAGGIFRPVLFGPRWRSDRRASGLVEKPARASGSP